MKKHLFSLMSAALILTILISNIGSLIADGLAFDGLRQNVLRLHILANSDSEFDQNMKLKVRDALLDSGILSGAHDLDEAEENAAKKLRDIETLAEITLEEYGCYYPVRAAIEDIGFDEREYGDITMPAGKYRALRIEIGEAKGHNWWCVMYPPLCLPAASDVTDNKKTEDEYFTEKERDIMKKPKKYRLKLALWEKIKEFTSKKDGECDDSTVQNDKNQKKA